MSQPVWHDGRKHGAEACWLYCMDCGSRDVWIETARQANSGALSDSSETAFCEACWERGIDGDDARLTTDRRKAAQARLDLILAERIATQVYGPAEPDHAIANDGTCPECGLPECDGCAEPEERAS